MQRINAIQTVANTCCSHCCAEFRHFFLSLIKGLDPVDKFNTFLKCLDNAVKIL